MQSSLDETSKIIKINLRKFSILFCKVRNSLKVFSNDCFPQAKHFLLKLWLILICQTAVAVSTSREITQKKTALIKSTRKTRANKVKFFKISLPPLGHIGSIVKMLFLSMGSTDKTRCTCYTSKMFYFLKTYRHNLHS